MHITIKSDHNQAVEQRVLSLNIGFCLHLNQPENQSLFQKQLKNKEWCISIYSIFYTIYEWHDTYILCITEYRN